MQVISEIRSAHAARDQETMARLVLECRNSERYADVLTYALGLDANVLDPERLAEWAEWTDGPVAVCHLDRKSDGLWWIDQYEWCLIVCGVVLATHEALDLQPLQHAWSTVPARAVLHVWEDWAREHVSMHLEAPRRAIEAKEAWCRGEVDYEALRVASDAALVSRYAAWSAGAAWAASAAARVAWVTAWATASVARNVARNIARVVAGDASEAARDAEYQKWSDAWTAYVIDQILNPNRRDQ